MSLYYDSEFVKYREKPIDINFVMIFITKYGGSIVNDIYIPADNLKCEKGVLYDIFKGVKLTDYFKRDYIWNLYINDIHMETLIVEDIDIKPMNFTVFLWQDFLRKNSIKFEIKDLDGNV